VRRTTLVAASLSLLALAACSESRNEVTSPDLDVAYGKSPTPTYNPNGPVWVLGDFTLTINLPGADVGVNQHPQGKGACGDSNLGEDPAVWYSQGSHQPTGAPFCAGGEATVVSLACHVDATGLPATYAFGTGGGGAPAQDQTANNENINFHSELIPQNIEQFAHFGAPTKKGQKGVTLAKDQTAFTFSCDDGSTGDAYVSLDNFNNFVGNLFTGEGVGDRRLKVELLGGVDVLMYATGDGPYTSGALVGTGDLVNLYWNFRSRLI
jgi:hypothetical protein